MGLLEFIQQQAGLGERQASDFSSRDLLDNDRWRRELTGELHPRSGEPMYTNRYLPEMWSRVDALGQDSPATMSSLGTPPWADVEVRNQSKSPHHMPIDADYEREIKSTLVQNISRLSIKQIIQFLKGSEMQKKALTDDEMFSERR